MKFKIAALIFIAGFTTVSFGQAQLNDAAQAPNGQPAAEMPVEVNVDTAVDDGAVEPATQPGPITTQTPGVQPTRRTTVPRYSRNRRTRTQPGGSALAAATPQSKRMASDFDLLTTRSIFIKGRQITATDTGATGSTDTTAQPTILQPERSLVFNGVTKSGIATAMIENSDSHQVSTVHVGDLIARGRVVAITLNTLDYEVNGHVSRIEIGQTLAGGVVQSPGEAVGTPSSGNTTQPANMSAGRQMGESIEAYMHEDARWDFRIRGNGLLTIDRNKLHGHGR